MTYKGNWYAVLYPKSVIRACMDFTLEEWIWVGLSHRSDTLIAHNRPS